MSNHGSVDLGQDNAAFEADESLPSVVQSNSNEDDSLENGHVDISNDRIKNDDPDTPTSSSLNEGPAEEDAPDTSGKAALDSPPNYGESVPAKAGYSGGFGNQPVQNEDQTSAPSSKAGDIVDVLSYPPKHSKNGHLNGISDPLQFSEKISDPEAPAEPERGQWSNQMEFLLSCIAMSVGLGNIWRFPFTAYENGGGAFLIPYLVVLLFVGRPIYFLELCLGQFCSLSQVKVWRINPFFRGVGYGSMIATLLVMSYYCSIMALCVFYFASSFQSTLPWTECNEEWFGECPLPDNLNTSNAEQYFVREVLKEKDNIDDGIGLPEWRMTLCLLFSWLVILGSLIKGVKSSGKVAYFTALFPYVVLLTLLIRGVTLDGAWKGIKYFIEPQWDQLYKPKVWYAAVSQCFYSLNTGFGSVIMFSSYNPFKHNIYRDAVILSFMDTFTSLLAGFTIFSVLGNLSHTTGIDISEVLDGGNGLAFISYPAAIAAFPWAPQFFAVMFFLMLFTLGIGSATADAGAIITIFVDQFPKVKRWIITVILCSTAFLFGLIYVTPGGQFILNMVDYFGASFVIFTTSVLEVMGVAWFYGLNNFIRDIEFMLDIRIGWYWKICWGAVIPVGLTAILVYFFAWDYEELTYKNVEYPTIAIVFGWLMAVAALSALPVMAIYSTYKAEGDTIMEKIKNATKPTENWGPRDPKIRAEWIDWKKYN